MPRFDILKQTEPSKSYRVAQVRAAYDLIAPKITEHFVGELTPPEAWKIGVITGPSGSGKTQIARHLWAQDYIVNYEYREPSVIDDLPGDTKDICEMLSNVGFGSIPSWLKPYQVLSQGEQMRIDIARAMLSKEKTIVFDEFTSTVDRNVAKFACATIKKTIRKTGKQFVAVSCHEDFLDWLEPDWVFDTATLSMRKKKRLPSNSTCEPWSATKIYGESLGDIIISITTCTGVPKPIA